MWLVPIACVVLTLLSIFLWAGFRWVRRMRKPRRRPWLQWSLHAAFHLLVTIPLLMGVLATWMVRTRPPERAYLGPNISEEGQWIAQTPGDPTDSLGPLSCKPSWVQTEDEVLLRLWWVPRRTDAKQNHSTPLTAICAHGLFRSALEIDRVGKMFHDQGCSVLLLEWRNHGASGRKRFRGGLDIALDVQAAARFIHGQSGHEQDGLLLYGISLGTAGVARAAPHVSHLKGVILDAPLVTLKHTAEALLKNRILGNPDSWNPIKLLTPLILLSWQTLAGFDIDEIVTTPSLQQLDPQIPVLLIGAGKDLRMPPKQVRDLFRNLPQPPPHKRLWIRDASRHGHAIRDDPETYLRHLSWLVSTARH